MTRRREDGGYWATDGRVSYHIDRKRIKLAKVMGTGTTEFRPYLDRLLAEADDWPKIPLGTSPRLAAIESEEPGF